MNRRSMMIISTVIAATLGLAACGSSSSGGATGASKGPSGVVGDTLTFASLSAPTSLDPAKADPGTSYFYTPAYASFTRLRADGTQVSDLATKWGFVGSGNTVYEVTLRPGVKFSDGSALDANAVKKSLDYVKKQTGAAPSLYLSNVSAIDVVNPQTVRLTLIKPDPGLAFNFSQAFVGSLIVSPKALDNPSSLSQTTAGAGPYMLDAAQSRSGDHYTYVPNPYYWDKTAVKWHKLVIKVVPNPNTILQSLQTGQAQVAFGDPTTLSAARSAGLDVATAPQSLQGMNLIDRAGKVAPALGDVRVRQALNYAIDRKAIATALYGSDTLPLSQFALKGGEGYDPALDSLYPYDVAKAKQLLADAGYANGFTFSYASTPFAGLSRLGEAMAGYWAKIGVKAEPVNAVSFPDYAAALTNGKNSGALISYGLNTMSSLYVGYMNPNGMFNGFHTSDPQLDALYATYAVATPDQAGPAAQKINDYLAQQAWAVPVVSGNSIVYSTKKVAGIHLDAASSGFFDITEVASAG